MIDIAQYKKDFLADVEANMSSDELTQKWLHKKQGLLSASLKSLGTIEDIEERKRIGAEINTLKQFMLERIGEGNDVDASKKSSSHKSDVPQIDPTLPGITPELGTTHPIRLVQKELVNLFSGLGFSVYEGNEIENELFCFEYLNIPETHPARDLQDTFYLKDVKDQANDSKLVLRTHTSNMQVRIMQDLEPPLRVIVPGRVFRNEATDATHDHTFFQLEGFVVDKDISIGNLTHTLTVVLSSLLQEDVKVRLRPGYFPYVEPGFEVDCYTESTGWMEMLGCGMIHPSVFTAAGYEEGKYTGFAFGIGINRLAQLKYGINDARDFLINDDRFLTQF